MGGLRRTDSTALDQCLSSVGAPLSNYYLGAPSDRAARVACRTRLVVKRSFRGVAAAPRGAPTQAKSRLTPEKQREYARDPRARPRSKPTATAPPPRQRPPQRRHSAEHRRLPHSSATAWWPRYPGNRPVGRVAWTRCVVATAVRPVAPARPRSEDCPCGARTRIPDRCRRRRAGRAAAARSPRRPRRRASPSRRCARRPPG
jgi:hypothetical protein